MASQAAALVKEATDLVGLVGEVTEVKGAGAAAKALCPFHTEKTPSLSVSADKGVWHCFGCGLGGDALDFVQQSQGVGFRESVDILARRAGIDLGPSSVRRTRPQQLDRIRWQTSEFCHELLRSDPSAARARAYLRRAHGYQSGDVTGFRIGWAPKDPSVVPEHLRSLGVSARDMVAARVARNGGGRPFATHIGRVLYPVATGHERVSGFAAEDGDGGIAPPIGGEGSLYGLGQARSVIAREGSALVVPDCPSVVAYHRAGLTGAVAPCGPKLTPAHLQTLGRFAERAVVVTTDEQAATSLLDSDLNSDDVALYMAETRYERPADLTRDEALAAVQAAIPLAEARLTTTLAGYRGAGNASARRRKLQAAKGVIQAETDPNTRMELAAAAASLTGLPVELILGSASLLDPAEDRTPAAAGLSL
ncbi:MAG: CHC2 zinc finger domain-containing protein [bacterium]|nr:CHC2 zinc finger domain-containing protein [bacterium]MDE0288506.1 CHC2 zinc finger domain-containing protein [bacterium]MDE0439257.1 CHC2 zinc finger domain-containing protein [bacterium]